MSSFFSGGGTNLSKVKAADYSKSVSGSEVEIATCRDSFTLNSKNNCIDIYKLDVKNLSRNNYFQLTFSKLYKLDILVIQQKDGYSPTEALYNGYGKGCAPNGCVVSAVGLTNYSPRFTSQAKVLFKLVDDIDLSVSGWNQKMVELNTTLQTVTLNLPVQTYYYDKSYKWAIQFRYYLTNKTTADGSYYFNYEQKATDSTPPKLTIGKPSGGSIVGSGTSTVYYAAPQVNVDVTFTDETSLTNYSSTSYYRYKWCTSNTSCSASYTSVGTSRSNTKVTGTIKTPSTEGTHYLWIEGDVKDGAGHYMDNNTNVNGVGSTSSNERVFTFIVDNTAPILSIYSPSGGTIQGSGTSTVYYAKPNASVYISFVDTYGLYNYSSVSLYRYKWSTSTTCVGGSYASIGSGRTLTSVSGTINVPSNEGTHYLCIEGDVKDYVGNYMSNSTNINGYGYTSKSARVFKFIIDSTSPTINTFTLKGNSGAESGYTNTTSITYSFTISENIENYSISGNIKTSINKNLNASSLSNQSATLSSGGSIKTLTLVVYDYAGNKAEKTSAITLDETTPVLGISLNGGGLEQGSGTSTIFYVKKGYKITISITENSSGLYMYSNSSYYRYKWCTSSSSCSTNYTSFSTTSRSISSISESIEAPSSDGTYYLWIEGNIKDLAGNYMNNSTNINGVGSASSATRIFKFVVDATAPVINNFTLTGNSDAQSGYTNTTSIKYAISFTEENIHQCKVVEGSTTRVSDCSANSSGTLTISSGDATKTLTLTVIDKAGNSATKTVKIVLDTNKPVINTFSLVNYNYGQSGYANSTLLIYTVKATDTNIYQFNIKEGNTSRVAATSLTSTTSKTGTLTISSGDGSKTLTLTITDKAGNSAVNTTTIILDTIAPAVKILQSSDKKTWEEKVGTKERYLKIVVTDANLKDGEFKYYLTSLSDGYGDKEITSSSDLNKYLSTGMLTNGEYVIPDKITISGEYYIFISRISDKAGNSSEGDDTYSRFYITKQVKYCDKYYYNCINDVPADVYCEYNPDDFEHCIHGILKEEYCSMIGNDSHCIDGYTREEYCSSYAYEQYGCIDQHTTEEYCEMYRYDERCDSYFIGSTYYDPTNLCPVGYIYIELDGDNICYAVSKGVKNLYCPTGEYNVLTGLCQDYIPNDFLAYSSMDLRNYYCPEGYPLVAMEGINIYCLSESESYYGQGRDTSYDPIIAQDIIFLNGKFQLSYLGILDTISGDMIDRIICPNFGIRNEDGECVLVSLAVPKDYGGDYMPMCEYDDYFIYDYDTGLCHYYEREKDESSSDIFCPANYGYAIFMGDRLLCADYTVGKGLRGYLNYFAPDFDKTPITDSEYYYDILCDRFGNNYRIPRNEFTFKLRNGGLLYKGDYIEVSMGLYEGDYNGVSRHSPYCEAGNFNALTGLCELNEMIDIGFGPMNNVACPNYFVPMLYNDYILYCGKIADIVSTELYSALEDFDIRFDFLQDLYSYAFSFYTEYYGELDIIYIEEVLQRAFDMQGRIVLLGLHSDYSYYPIIPEIYNQMEHRIYSLNSVFDGYSVGYDGVYKDMYYTGPIYGQEAGGTTTNQETVYSQYFGKYKLESDTTPPTINTFTITGNSGAQSGYTNTTNVSYTVKATDDHIYQYKIMEGNTTRVSLTTLTSGVNKTGTLTISGGDGEKTLTLTVYDEVGNSSTKSVTIVLDTATPTINTFTLTGNSGAQRGYTNTTSIKYAISFTEKNIHQCKVVEGSTTRVSDCSANSSGTLTISSGDATKTLTLTVYDKAGNSATKTATIILDTTTPTINTFTLTGNSGAQAGFTNTTENVSYTVKATDTNIYQFNIKEGSTSRVGATTLTSATNKTGTLSISSGDATKTLTLTVIDKAGNSVTKTATIVLDTTLMNVCINPSENCQTSLTTTSKSTITIGVKETNISSISEMRLYATIDVLTSATVSNWLSYKNIKEFNFTSVVNSGKYYLYVAIPTSVTDKAGNGVKGVAFTAGDYNVIRLEVTNTGSKTSSITASNSNDANNNLYKSQPSNSATNSIISLTLQNYNNSYALSTIISNINSKFSLQIIDGKGELTGTISKQSSLYENVLVKKGDSYEVVTIVIIDNTPRVTGSANAGSTMEVVKGEEIGNLGMSFTSVDGAKLESETVITLNGVRVKRVDTNLLGEYEIRQIAKDNKGRSKEIITRIIVKDDNKEVVKEVEIPDIINNEVKVVVPNRVDNEVKVEDKKVEINNYQVEMIVNSEVKEKKYRKRKEERGNKEKKLEFKLFSKYFFKVYDG